MNPVLWKDLVTLMRMRRIAAIQVLFLAVLVLVVLLEWPQGGVLSLAMGKSDDLLLGIMLGQLMILILCVPGVAAVSLTSEYEGNTLEMLYASRLSAWEIAWGKLLSSIAFPIILILTALPLVALLNLRGSLDLTTMLWSYGVLILTAAMISLLSLTLSALSRQTSAALVISYLAILGVCIGVMVPAAILLDQSSGWLATVLHDARALSPVAALLAILRPQMPGDFTGAAKGNPSSQYIFLVASALIIAVCVLTLVLRLRRPPAEVTRKEDSTLKERKPIAGPNPVFAKERRTASLHGGSWLLRLFYGMLVLSLLLSLMSLYGGAEYPDLLRYVFQVLVTLQLAGIAVVTPSLTSSSISGELEAGTFEMLGHSRLSAGQIFWGKLGSALLPALLPLVALLPAYAIVAFVNPAYLWYTLAVLPVLVMATLFCCIVGLACSSVADNTARATVTAYIAVMAVLILPAIAWWAGINGIVDNARLVSWLSTPSALVAGLNVVPPGGDFGKTDPVSAGSITIPNLCLTAGLCLLLLAAARVRLAHLLRRG